MSEWPSKKAREVLSALIHIGWKEKRQSGSHLTLSRLGYSNYIWAFHCSHEIGGKMLARIAKKTGLTPEDL